MLEAPINVLKSHLLEGQRKLKTLVDKRVELEAALYQAKSMMDYNTADIAQARVRIAELEEGLELLQVNEGLVTHSGAK